jgi:hypothetical protein
MEEVDDEGPVACVGDEESRANVHISSQHTDYPEKLKQCIGEEEESSVGKCRCRRPNLKAPAKKPKGNLFLPLILIRFYHERTIRIRRD